MFCHQNVTGVRFSMVGFMLLLALVICNYFSNNCHSFFSFVLFCFLYHTDCFFQVLVYVWL